MCTGRAKVNTAQAKWDALFSKPWLLPDRVLAYVLVKLRRRVSLGAGSFGWPQAIFYFGIDDWQRYASVTQQIKAFDDAPVAVLDVGGGSGIIREFLDSRRYHLYVLDINIQALTEINDLRLGTVVGDGCRLPFKEGSFDIVICVDSLEHVPDSRKVAYCCELKRVAKRCVIIRCPADSADGEFQGTTYDAKFLEWYRQRFKKDEPNTLEHLNSGLPKLDELHRLFPEASVTGERNANVWFRQVTVSYTPYIRFVTGLLYKLCLQRKDDVPPYRACLLTWRKG
jgi:ubiquinone/menaquinone biosynthesis C-methylase UbiE